MNDFRADTEIRVVEKGPQIVRTQATAMRPERRLRGARNPARRATDFPTDSTAVRAKNRPGEAAILEITGKSWREWFVLLNAAGVEREQRKKVIAANTSASFWWRNVVLLAYELDRGMRQQYARPLGYEVSVSRTISAPAAGLIQYWLKEDLRHTWLGAKAITVQQTAGGKLMRVSWDDGDDGGSWLNVEFHSQDLSKMDLSKMDGSKTRVVVRHQNLPQKKIAEIKAFWTKALKNLKAAAEAG